MPFFTESPYPPGNSSFLLHHITIIDSTNTTSSISVLPPGLMGRRLFGCNSSTSTADLDTIESSLRLCSLAAHGGSNQTNTNLAVHLNSEVPLPNNWEQVLNIQTGEIYFLNRESGSKTSVDPRGGVVTASSFWSAESEAESTVDDASYDGSRSSCSRSSAATTAHNNSSSYNESGGSYSAASSTLSVATTSSSSVASSSSHPQQGFYSDVLVLVGCKVCLTLSMVPRTEAECPKCRDTALVRF